MYAFQNNDKREIAFIHTAMTPLDKLKSTRKDQENQTKIRKVLMIRKR